MTTIETLYMYIYALQKLDYKDIFEQSKENYRLKKQRERMFDNPDKYYLDNLIYSIQSSLQELDMSYEEYEVLFETLMFLDDKRQKFDDRVRCKKEDQFEEQMHQKEIEISELSAEFSKYKSKNAELL